jgi:hypothetical protein
MTRWVAIFEDNPEPEMRSIRKEHAEEHFAHLAKNSDKILLGGGLRNAPGEWYCGGMWVIEGREPRRCRRAVRARSLLQARTQEGLPPVCLGQSALL